MPESGSPDTPAVEAVLITDKPVVPRQSGQNPPPLRVRMDSGFDKGKARVAGCTCDCDKLKGKVADFSASLGSALRKVRACQSQEQALGKAGHAFSERVSAWVAAIRSV